MAGVPDAQAAVPGAAEALADGLALRAPDAPAPRVPVARSGKCTDADQNAVTLVIDYQRLGGATKIYCVTGLSSGATGADVLKAAGVSFSYAAKQAGFICRLNGRPSASEKIKMPDGSTYQEKCSDTPPGNAYWSYWQASPGGGWSYSSKGASSSRAKIGGFEGYSFQGASRVAPRVSPVVDAAPKTEEPPATTTQAPATQPAETAQAPATTQPPTTTQPPATAATSKSTTKAATTQAQANQGAGEAPDAPQQGETQAADPPPDIAACEADATTACATDDPTSASPDGSSSSSASPDGASSSPASPAGSSSASPAEEPGRADSASPSPATSENADTSGSATSVAVAAVAVAALGGVGAYSMARRRKAAA
jgi:hypothetical protein